MKIRDIELTKEQEEQLREYLPINPKSERWYVPHAFRELPEAIRPRFKIRTIGGIDRLAASDALRGEVSIDGKENRMSFKHGAFCKRVCVGNVLGWENYIDPQTGKDVEYDRSLNVLGDGLISELATAIMDRSAASLDDSEKLGFA